MKRYEAIREDNNADHLKELLSSLPYVKEVNPMEILDTYTLAAQRI